MRLLFALMVAACSSNSSTPPAFPADYAATYTEVRNCRGPSVAHDGAYIRVVASPDALAPYQNRTDPFPVGAIVLKEEYNEDDRTCARAVVNYSVMVRLADGTDPTMLDWTWQHVSAARDVLDEDPKKCSSCHSNCDGEGGGYAGTCEDP